jgi:hypothetical protein
MIELKCKNGMIIYKGRTLKNGEKRKKKTKKN